MYVFYFYNLKWKKFRILFSLNSANLPCNFVNWKRISSLFNFSSTRNANLSPRVTITLKCPVYHIWYRFFNSFLWKFPGNSLWKNTRVYCGSCGFFFVSHKVFSTAQVLLFMQTTAIHHSVFSLSSSLYVFILEFRNLSLSVPSVLSWVLFCSLSCSTFYSFLLFFLFPVLFSSTLLIYFIFWSPSLFSFQTCCSFFSLFKLLHSACRSHMFYYYSICCLSVILYLFRALF